MSSASANRAKHRRLSLSLRMWMVLVLALCLWLGHQVHCARQQRDAVAVVKSHGGWVHYDYEFVNGKVTSGRRPWAPGWLRTAFGDDYFQAIRQVSLVYDDSTGKRYDNTNVGSCDDVLARIADQQGVKSLLLKGAQATDQGLAHLRNLTSLEDLYVWDSILVSDAGVENLKGLVNLRNLHLDNSKITDDGFLKLARLKKLEHLVLEKHAFSDRGMASVKGMTKLTWLCIGGSNRIASAITDDGLALIAGHTGLENLDISYSKVTDRGLKHLARLKKLTILDLEGCQITDDGLAELSGLSDLKWLLLPETRVTGEGLEHLKDLKKLTLVSLPRDVPKERKQRFQRAMPPSLKIW